MAKESEKVRMSPPWDSHMQMLKSFFGGDGRVVVVPATAKGEKKGEVVAEIGVKDADALIALDTVLRKEVRFGNVTLKIRVLSENDAVLAKVAKKVDAGKRFTPLAALKEVLKGNPAFSKVRSDKGAAFDFTFVVFRPLVLQWYSDNLGSPWKISTSTYELAAQGVFADKLGVSYATEPPKGASFRKGVL